jgi:hypothetical protein
MKSWPIILTGLMLTIVALANPDYAINVWIQGSGTNMSYSTGHGPVHLKEIQDTVRQVADISSNQTVHVITDNGTCVTNILQICATIYRGGLTNVVVTIFNSTQDSSITNSVLKFSGMNITVDYIKNSKLTDTKTVQP